MKNGPFGVTPQHQPEFVLNDAQFAALRDLLARYSGVYLDETRQQVLMTSLVRRLEATDLTLDAYIAAIAQPGGRGELQQLVERTLNHETIFFRNMPHMRALRDVILPSIHRRKPAGAPVRIWSAGCATGEEAYSLAITALEALQEPLPRPIQIYATDLSEQALARARTGSYRGRTLRNVGPEVRHRYFQHHGDTWTVDASVRALITFAQLNLLDPFPDWTHNIDIIFCQNVTIYFQIATCRNLIDRFYHALPAGGLLFLGFSETLWNIHNGFRLQEISGSFVYCKETYDTASHGAPSVRQVEPAHTASLRPWYRTASPAARPVRSAAGESGRNGYRTRTPVTDGAKVTTPSSAEHVQQGHHLLDAGQVEEALAMLAQLPLDGPHAPHAVALMARAHANRGDLDLAIAEARRAIELDTLMTDAYLLLGMLYAQQGQLLQAVQYFERGRYLDPHAALISFHLAETYRRLNQRDKALREYRNTLHKLTNHSPGELLDGVAVNWIRETCQSHINLLLK